MNEPARSSVTSVPTRLGPLRVETVGSGPPAVLWHSLFVDSTSWVRVREPLASVRRLLLFAAPGHHAKPPLGPPAPPHGWTPPPPPPPDHLCRAHATLLARQHTIV